MTDLQRKALASLPMDERQVENIYIFKLNELNTARSLCVSHERLRAELRGAETLLAETQAEVEAVLKDGNKGITFPDAESLIRMLGKQAEPCAS